MNEEYFIVIITAVVAPILTLIVQSWFGRNKTKSSSKVDNANAESILSEAWQGYAEQQKKDKEELRREFTSQIASLKKLHQHELQDLRNQFNFIINKKDQQIQRLGDRIKVLEDDLRSYNHPGLANNTV